MDAPTNVSQLVASAAADHPDRPALRHPDGQTRTWAEVEQQVSLTAGFLQARGIGPGDRVALVLPNGLAFPAAYWGTLRAGATVVPVNPAYTPRELRHILEDSQACLVLAHPSLTGTVTAATSTPVVAYDDHPVPTTDRLPEARDCEGEPAVICYTSGTTGRPKGALLSHDNFLANLADFGDLPLLRLNEDDVLLGLLPFFHIFGLNVILNAAARHGASVLAMDRFHPVSSLAAMAEHGVTVAYGAPPVFAAWNAVAGQQPLSLPALRAAVSGADSLPVATWKLFADQFGIEILEGYGLTETAPVLTSSAAAGAVRPGTVGVPLPSVRIRLRDVSGRPVATGQVGEICASGPNVFSGYHREPEATADVLDDGWFRTGDLGTLDADGYLTIAGRLKDMIIVSGFNVYPREVEEVLLAHPAVSDAAVIGIGDSRTGERVRALVVPAPGQSLDPDDLAAHCRGQLARYKQPRETHVVDALPRTPTGKLDRRALQSLQTQTISGG